jgi:hypothetical protein
VGQSVESRGSPREPRPRGTGASISFKTATDGARHAGAMTVIWPRAFRFQTSYSALRRTRRAVAILGAVLGLGSTSCGAASPRETAAPHASAQVIEAQAVVARVAHYIDGRRWPELRALFADRVETDYRSLFGGDVQVQSAEQLVLEGWRPLLSPLEVTQHLLGPIDVEITGETARAECHVRGYHRAPAAASGPEWMVAGHYVFSLMRADGTWKITQITLHAAYQTGNRDLLREAAAKP